MEEKELNALEKDLMKFKKKELVDMMIIKDANYRKRVETLETELKRGQENFRRLSEITTNNIKKIKLSIMGVVENINAELLIAGNHANRNGICNLNIHLLEKVMDNCNKEKVYFDDDDLPF